MSTVSMSELHAVQALLNLQNNVCDATQSDVKYTKEDAETAKLFLSCVITSNVQTTTPNVIAIPKIGTEKAIAVVPKTSNGDSTVKPLTQTPKRKSPDRELPNGSQVNQSNEEHTNKRSKIFKRKPIRYSSAMSSPDFDKETVNKAHTQATCTVKTSGHNSNNTKAKMRETATQTEDLCEIYIIKKKDATISKLLEKIKSLEAQIQMNNRNTPNEDYVENNKSNIDDTVESADDNYESEKETSIRNKVGTSSSDFNSSVLTTRSINTNANDMVPLGNGNAMIPARIYRCINWSSYTSATRKLLTAVFSRRVLATHSLTGKRSPAFPLKPRKKKLDTALVNDIVQTVVERCHVPENVVRTSITTKCADESKMLRTRQYKTKQKYKVNKENIPSDSESD